MLTTMRIPHHATRFILMHTKQNENVGAAARAMKTMGFSDLALVSPNDPKVLQRSKTIQRASGATDILKGAKIYNSLSEALIDKNHYGNGEEIVCGTGMPVDMYQERSQRNYVEPRKFFDKLMNDNDVIANIHENNDKITDDETRIRIAIVFGNEKSGMEEADMDVCDYMLGIPTNPKFGSLNLASAVQLIAYDWRMALGYYDDVEQFYPS